MKKTIKVEGSSLVLPPLNRVPFNPVMSIQQALEWAFGREYARLSFDSESEGIPMRDNVDTIWRMMQRGDVGCQIDGGGRSRPHPDAEALADAVARLAANLGGRGMAIMVATHAKAGTVPDAMTSAVPRLVPKEWQQNQHGLRGKAEKHGTDKVRIRGRVVERDRMWVPCVWEPTPAKIANMRRGYMEWRRALFELSCWFRGGSGLSKVVITDTLPALEPWKLQHPR